MSVPTWEEIKESLGIPDVELDRFGRRVINRSAENLPKQVKVSAAFKKGMERSKWDRMG